MLSDRYFVRWLSVKSIFKLNEFLIVCLFVCFRNRYMIFSLQSFPTTVAKFLTKTLEQEDQSRRASSTIRPNTGRESSQGPLSSSSSSSSLITSVKPYLNYRAFLLSYVLLCIFVLFCFAFEWFAVNDFLYI